MNKQLKVLTWGNAHSFRLFRAGLNDMAILKIRKTNGAQTIVVDLRNVDIVEIARAWDKQGAQWKTLAERPGDPFEAVRVIEVTPDVFVVWYLFHQNDAPADLCQVWRNATPEQIMLAYMDPEPAAP